MPEPDGSGRRPDLWSPLCSSVRNGRGRELAGTQKQLAFYAQLSVGFMLHLHALPFYRFDAN